MLQGSCRVVPGKVLCGNSGPDVDWLVDKFDLDMRQTKCKLTCRAAT